MPGEANLLVRLPSNASHVRTEEPGVFVPAAAAFDAAVGRWVRRSERRALSRAARTQMHGSLASPPHTHTRALATRSLQNQRRSVGRRSADVGFFTLAIVGVGFAAFDSAAGAEADAVVDKIVACAHPRKERIGCRRERESRMLRGLQRTLECLSQ